MAGKVKFSKKAKAKSSRAAQYKLTPSMIEMCKQPFMEQVNAMLDSGESPNSVTEWINQQGFKISAPTVYKYAKIRQRCIMDGVETEIILENSKGFHPSIIATGNNDPLLEDRRQKAKSSIQILDRLIQLGAENLEKEYASGEKKVNAQLLLQVIQTKRQVSEDGTLTEYGIQQLRELEKNKYEMIIDLVMQYVDPAKHKEVLEKITKTEDEFYQDTEYYEEYLRSRGLNDDEIRKRMREVFYEKKLKELGGYEDDDEETAIK